MGERPPLFLGLLADQPELIAEVGVLRWREWGSDSLTPGHWIETTARESGRDRLPLTVVAMDLDGHAVGAVALGEVDDALTERERRDRAPWLLGMVVRREERHCGVGRLLVTALEDLARDLGQAHVWVATGRDAVDFYRQCGWREEEQLVTAKEGLATTVLKRGLAQTGLT